MTIVCKEKTDQEVRIEEKASPDELKYLCRFCRKEVADAAHGIRVDDQGTHVFANPHGQVFEIGCFSNAPGATTASEPSSDFSWFKGYEWQVAVCSQCSGHLGWFYSQTAYGFWGLIMDNLVTR
ncbi:MAG: cereblon family protein [Desulfobacterales bacterium]|nr:cereblon family protein [Desulfobacterales bacterium]